MKKPNLKQYLALFMMFLCLSGCGMAVPTTTTEISDDYVAAEEESDLTVVGYSQLGSESVWRTTNTTSVQNALTSENGFFLIFQNGRQKQENQIKAIRSFISQRVDYIIFSPVVEEGWDTVLKEAKDAGIPVVLVDRMINTKDDSLYTTWIGSDSREEGEKAGKWLEEYLTQHNREEEEINIVVLQGTTGASAQQGRTMGFDSIADTHLNWTILEQTNADFTTAKGKEVMEQFLRRYPDIDVVVSQNDDMTFGAIEAIEEAGMTTGVNGDITLISFDAVYSALKMVEDGTINVDIECNPLQGEYVKEILNKLENGEAVERSYKVEEKVFTQENVTEYLDERAY